MESCFQVKSSEFPVFDLLVTGICKKDALNNKNVVALRSHCEAERRRRERINGHLATLRSIVPCSAKMDKATLLAEVITHVKMLKKQAKVATKGLLIPMDIEELTVEPYNNNYNELQNFGVFSYRVSLCCDYKPEIIRDMRQAIYTLKLTITKAEISTLGTRMKIVFIVIGRNKQEIEDDGEEIFARSIRQTLRSVLDKISASEEYSPRTMFPSKRQKASIFMSSEMNI